jgi:thermostable 8-oxoguanine DNA glycosylase
MANNLSQIFNTLEQGEWRILLGQLRSLEKGGTREEEIAVVDYLIGSKKFPGLGQKQSRNFIQWLGLSRYEIPLDSRVLKKMKEFGVSFVPQGLALSDKAVYLFIEDGLQQISRQLGVFPCELDACIFASFDTSNDALSDNDDVDV